MSRELDVAVSGLLSAKGKASINDKEPAEIPHYSTDGNAMLLLDAQMQERGFYIIIMNPHTVNMNSGQVVDFAAAYLTLEQLKNGDYEENRTAVHFQGAAVANTEPCTRALAAYKALTCMEADRG